MSNTPSNLMHVLPDSAHGECFDDLLVRPGCRIERIVSHGQASPPGFWYEQGWDEWVLILAGEAVLGFERPSEHPSEQWSWCVSLQVGDNVLIPKDQRHRVESTAATGNTIWLAVHITPDRDSISAPPSK